MPINLGRFFYIRKHSFIYEKKNYLKHFRIKSTQQEMVRNSNCEPENIHNRNKNGWLI